jgi:hypothetical protein
MAYEKCLKCGEYHFSTDRCKPLFEYQIPEFGPEWLSIRALSFQDAAEKACEKDDNDSGEYTIVKRGNLDKILVRDGTGTVKEFSVEAETVPEYYAQEIKA